MTNISRANENNHLVFERPDGWYFLAGTGVVGPYGSEQAAIDKLAEWEAYVVTPGGCHACDGRLFGV